MKKAKFKIQRRLGTALPGFGDKKAKGPIERRNYPPGMHGQSRGKKLSEYGLRLKEKQKIRFHYGLSERQLLNAISKSKKKEANWLVYFAKTVEKRLDNVLFRLGFFPTMASARQFVTHKHVLVNGKGVDIPSYILKIGDEVSLKDEAYDNVLFLKTRKEPTLELPKFLNVKKDGKKEIGVVIEEPTVEDIPFEFNQQYFLEYYGKVK